jgi:hypothetical protein
MGGISERLCTSSAGKIKYFCVVTQFVFFYLTLFGGMRMLNKEMQYLADQNGGKLPTLAWPGLYPMFYVDNEGEVLCPDCANKDGYADTITGQDCNWEDPDLYCDDCNKRIESAYAEEE